MSVRRLVAALSVLGAAIALVAAATAGPTSPTLRPRAAPGTRLPLAIVTADGEVSIVEATGARRTIAELEAPHEASLRAATGPNGFVFLDVDRWVRGDLSFAGALVAVREGAKPVELATDVVHGSTPLPLPDGRVLVSRGVAGPASDGASRVDDLRVDAIDPSNGAVLTIATHTGYLLFLAGASGSEVLLYRVGIGGADIVAARLDGDHAERTIAENVPPFARDFSVDPIDERLVYVNRRGADWVTTALDLRTGEDISLVAGSFMPMIPRALPFPDAHGHAEILLTEDPERGPSLRSSSYGGPELRLGPGSAHVADAEPESGWIAGTVGPAGERAHVFVANVRSGDVDAWPIPDRPTFVAGFMRGGR
jgi:hypothetical protein